MKLLYGFTFHHHIESNTINLMNRINNYDSCFQICFIKVLPYATVASNYLPLFYGAKSADLAQCTIRILELIYTPCLRSSYYILIRSFRSG